MAKHRSPRNENQASVGKSLTVEVPLPVLGVLSETRRAHDIAPNPDLVAPAADEIGMFALVANDSGHRAAVFRDDEPFVVESVQQ